MRIADCGLPKTVFPRSIPKLEFWTRIPCAAGLWITHVDMVNLFASETVIPGPLPGF